ncbi:MAG: hypothetical protein FD126_1233 [Elusimicrobia bacterium]|nr:MAG: hypothetical protein FD126_1233 [Elusimicrobiota bacterium]
MPPPPDQKIDSAFSKEALEAFPEVWPVELAGQGPDERVQIGAVELAPQPAGQALEVFLVLGTFGEYFVQDEVFGRADLDRFPCQRDGGGAFDGAAFVGQLAEDEVDAALKALAKRRTALLSAAGSTQTVMSTSNVARGTPQTRFATPPMSM